MLCGLRPVIRMWTLLYVNAANSKGRSSCGDRLEQLKSAGAGEEGQVQVDGG